MSAEPVATLGELLCRRAGDGTERLAFRFLASGEADGPIEEVSFGGLFARAAGVAAALDDAGVGPGDRAIIAVPPGPHFLAAFFGCAAGGVVPVPLAPRAGRDGRTARAIASDCGARALLTVSALDRRGDADPSLRRIAVDTAPPAQAVAGPGPRAALDDPALLQYTSGSTGAPRGVVVTHASLFHNQRVMRDAFGHDAASEILTWLPPFHDMGLIFGIVHPVFLGAPCTIMTPTAFVQRPARWLEAIGRFRARTSGGPSSAYDLCLRRVTDAELARLDLSSWEIAFNGAEPVRASTIDRFAERFGARGFRRRAFYPCYGLAEATLMASGGAREAEPVVLAVSASALERGRVEAPEGEADARALVGCGGPWLGGEIAIVDPEAHLPRTAGELGEIWLRGESIARGYWNRPEETAETFGARLAGSGAGPFLRTGDLGFVREGELFIAGRRKDLVIIRGRNLYPQDLEWSAEEADPAVRPGGVAAFSIEEDGEERLVVVAEAERAEDAGEGLAGAIRRALAERHGVAARAVVLVAPRAIPRTSSGKVKRRECRKAFLEGSLPAWHRSDLAPAPEPRVGRRAAPNEESRARADALIAWLRGWAETRVDFRLMDERRSIPPHVVLELGERGALGLTVPERWGGLGLTERDALRVYEQLAAIDLNLASFVGVHTTIGTRPIARFAPGPLRDALLPKIAAGRTLAAFALTEPGAGANFRGIATRAAPAPGGGWRLDGEKVWIGTGAWAGVITVIARAEGPRGEPLGMSAFALGPETPGLRIGPEALTMGVRGMVQSRIHLDGAQVEPGRLLGEAGQGAHIAQDAIGAGRLGIAAMSLGGMRRCGQLMLRYAERRRIATGRLIDHALARERLADLAVAADALEALVHGAAELIDAGHDLPDEVLSAAKILGPELLWRAADDLVQLLGGRGYMEPNLAPRILRDARLLRIFEGPTEALRAHLGAQVARAGSPLFRLLEGPLGAPAIAADLRDEVARIGERWAALGPHQAALRTGEVAALAALEAFAARASSEAAVWARRRRGAALREALEEPAAGIPGAEAVAARVRAFVATIGDVEPSLSGEEVALDPLLRRAGDASPPPPRTPPPLSSPAPAAREAAGSPRAREIERRVIEWIARAARIEAGRIDPARPLADYGLDSVLAVELAEELEGWLGVPLEPTIAWSFPTIEALARHLAGEPATLAAPPLAALSDAELARALAAEIGDRHGGSGAP